MKSSQVVRSSLVLRHLRKPQLLDSNNERRLLFQIDAGKPCQRQWDSSDNRDERQEWQLQPVPISWWLHSNRPQSCVIKSINQSSCQIVEKGRSRRAVIYQYILGDILDWLSPRHHLVSSIVGVDSSDLKILALRTTCIHIIARS